jgi:hypothetical protein
MNSFEEKDHGYEEVIEAIRDFGDVEVSAGVHSDDADQVTDDDGEPQGLNLAALLSIHEFGAEIDHPGGTPYIITDDGPVFVSKDYPDPDGYTDPHQITIPQRSVLNATLIENEQRYTDLQKHAIIAVLDGRMRPVDAFGLVAQALEGDIKDRFGSDDLAPNAASTIRQKGSSSPLIDEGQLRKAVAARVTNDE